jgi:hypothetical protein
VRVLALLIVAAVLLAAVAIGVLLTTAAGRRAARAARFLRARETAEERAFHLNTGGVGLPG